ncbi:hypothetical protein Si067_01087 [Streptococcus infantarius subsp. infantarius]|nr:hypothetical protein [Streptococcus infantarius subsp. infantarius]
MNKQEAIEKLEYLKRLLEEGSKDSYNHGFINALKYTLNVVKQLKKQEKPKVPQFVADWYKDNQDDLEVGVYDLCVNLYNCDLEGKIKYWFDCDSKKPIETLVKMKLFGYEIEKEKLYTVELPNPNSKGNNKIYLCKDDTTGKVYLCKGNFNPSKNRNLRLTESEIKKDFEWAWQFAEEVKE